MKKKLSIILICIAAAFAVIVAIIVGAESQDKTKYEKVRFEVTADIKPWQTLMVKITDDYLPLKKSGDIFVGETKKIKGSLLIYEYILGDEWGNTYYDAAVDVAGKRFSRKTLITESATFLTDLAGKKTLDAKFTLTSNIQGEIYVQIDYAKSLMKKTGGGYEHSATLGIGNHTCTYYLFYEGEYIQMQESQLVVTVSRDSTAFAHSATFVIPQPRSMTLKITLSASCPALYIYIGGEMIKASLSGGVYTVSFDIDRDCNFAVFVSSTGDKDGINYDAVFMGNTKDYDDIDEIFIRLP